MRPSVKLLWIRFITGRSRRHWQLGVIPPALTTECDQVGLLVARFQCNDVTLYEHLHRIVGCC